MILEAFKSSPRKEDVHVDDVNALLGKPKNEAEVI